ncbi:MAG: hypothetical protein IJ352_09740 [Muribaculaceae bacterium]|nr:hypothetical protein [Muribaculaceae bacterium]
MKRFWRIVSIALICGALATPQLDARGRNNSGQRSSTSTSRSSSPSRSNSSRNNSPKPGNNSSRPGGNNNTPKPGGNSNTPKPGSNNNAPKPGGNNTSRPGGNNHNSPKPGGNNHYAPKPGGNHNNHGNHNAPKPGSNHYHAPNHGHGHVHRPHCPPPRPYHRPTPPPSFRPYHGCPTFRGVFGITFGTAINISLDYLYRNSYSVYGYGNDVIYLRNVNQYGYMWPDATLYYGSGGLTGSQFMYSTNYYDRGRYNMVYNSLVGQYGAPISVQNTSNGITATWWGYDGQYVSLEFHPAYTNNGQLRYFTTLSFGM